MESVAELAKPTLDLIHTIPHGSQDEDTVHDLHEWRRAAS